MVNAAPGRRRRNQLRGSEFRAYSDVRDDLRRLGWNTDSPARSPTGQVYEQHEFVGHDPGLSAALGQAAPENVVVVDGARRLYWALEVKRSMGELNKAVGEARAYAERINLIPGQRCAFYTGIAGGPTEGYLRRTQFIRLNGEHVPVEFEGAPLTSLLPREQLLELEAADTGSVEHLVLDEAELLRVADDINDTLHGASINKDDRAAVVASILLTIAVGNFPDVHLTPETFAEQINITAKARLARVRKQHFAQHIALRMPDGSAAQEKYVSALVRTADALRHINIAAAMRSGDDVLGEFYEAFLKHGNSAKDIGIVLTPRHITRWATEVLDISVDDVVYDPTCGTGGFLVSAYDYVRRNTTDEDGFEAFRTQRLFGIEQQPKIAALAVINMIFRGDGSTNIVDNDALRQALVFRSNGRGRTAQFASAAAARTKQPGATRVLMNPPFALNASDEREYEFVEHALRQTEDGGLLFAVLPAPVLVKSGQPLVWRRDRLLPNHTLRAVVSFPEDLFYPGVSMDTVGIVVEKGRPHRDSDEVIWARVARDGYVKVKGKRLASTRAANDLAAITESVVSGVRRRSHTIQSVPALVKKAALDRDDDLVELLPQVYLDEPVPSVADIRSDIEHAIREYLSLVIRSADYQTFREALEQVEPTEPPSDEPDGFRSMSLVELFGPLGESIVKGSIHALNVVEPGTTPVVSSSTDYNGIMGFYDLDDAWPRWTGVITVASNGTPLTSYYHPYSIVAKDDVFVCTPPKDMQLATIFYLLTVLNSLTWRFSYYRKCYFNKIPKIAVPVPINADGTIAQGWLSRVAESCPGWSQLQRALPQWHPQPWKTLGRRTWNSTTGGSPS